MAEISLGLSFDDVLLVPTMSSVLPGDADLSTHITAGIHLFLPVVSAAMDTVSEHDLAIALAREGGMGVIHRACPIDEQVTMVSRVKRSENAVILIFSNRSPFARRIRSIMCAKSWRKTGSPVFP
jgi:IMP dehydrogenase